MMRNRFLAGIVLVLGVLAALGVFASDARATDVSVNVVQVRASNDGVPYVDPALGDLGAKLEGRYTYRRYVKVGESTQNGAIKCNLRFPLTGGMMLSLDVLDYKGKRISMQAMVIKDTATPINTSLRQPSGRCVVLSVPLGADVLILVITPVAN